MEGYCIIGFAFLLIFIAVIFGQGNKIGYDPPGENDRRDGWGPWM